MKLNAIDRGNRIEIDFRPEHPASQINWRGADEEEWYPTPYKSADAGCHPSTARAMVLRWLRSLPA